MKAKSYIIAGCWALVFMLMHQQLMAQFYNGHQMTFGKNRVQYNDFYWQYYRFDKFDTYFYVGGNQLAEYVSKEAMSQMESLEYSLEQILQRRIIFIVYNKQSEFRQSNIGLVTGDDDYNVGGVVRIVDNKVFLYYEGDHHKLDDQIRASIVEILVNEMLYGGSFRSRLSTSVMLNLPEWYVPGLISFYAFDNDAATETQIKNIFLNTKNRKINHLHGDVAKYAGHSFWRYVSETYGRETVADIVYMNRITKEAESGFLYVLGVPLRDVVNDWYYYYNERYNHEVTERNGFDEKSQAVKKKTNKKKVYQQICVSPDGHYMAYTSNEKGKYSIWLYDTQTQKSKRIVTREHKIDQITDYSYPVLAWHPKYPVLSYVYERKGKIWFEYYDVSTCERQLRELFYVDKVLDYEYSPDGMEIVFSAVDNGYTDLFIYSLAASTFTRLTNDLADDLNPRFVKNGTEIIFSSNRLSNRTHFQRAEEPSIGKELNLFIYPYKTAQPELQQLTNNYRANSIKPIEAGNDKYLYLSDANGMNNQFYLTNDSTISFIDTAIHYRAQITNVPITNTSFSFDDFDYSPATNQTIGLFKGIKRYYFKAVNPNYEGTEVHNTWFREYSNTKTTNDSILKAELSRDLKPDSVLSQKHEALYSDSLIDINYYVFDVEKDSRNELSTLAKADSNVFRLPKQMVYFTNFYNNLMVTQVDFGFMNQSYQAYTGSAYYYNPGMNLFTKVGAIDLFEDYKITAGIRWSFDLHIDEFLFSVENLKERLDKQYIFYRQVYSSSDDDYYTVVHSNTLLGVYRYPLAQIYGFKLTVSGRTDQFIYKAIDSDGLNKENDLKFWGGLKGEFIFDNTRKFDINTYNGTRFKIFGEYYANMGNGDNNHMFVVGFDVRNYFPIHRDLIFASRLAGSSSFGNSLLIYYLGGVDNWMNLSSKNPTFDSSTQINTDKNWAYQSVATNMRGFVQNVRNGNSFGVLNLELRWPVIRYLYNRPLSSDLLNHFMVVGFTDVGSAWEGWNPLNANNAYDYEPIENGPVTVIVDRKHSPLVAGVGFGIRSRLLGYYIRTDWAWGIDGGRVLPRVFYLSLSTDF